MKNKKRKCNARNKNCNSRIGDSCRNCNNSSTSDFAKNKGTITDNEYEVNSEHNCNLTNKKKRSK